MNIPSNVLKNADSCRFCWMCHHICPVGNATGLERNTARARGLAVSLVARDGAEVTEDMLENMYECCLCGGCTNVCVTGWDPIVFTKHMRNYAALEGILPEYINKLIENFEENGNIYGVDKICDTLDKKIKAHAEKQDTLFFIGADGRYKACKNAVQAIEVMEKSGEKFTVLSKEPDSGYSYETLMSATAETKAVMEKCANELSKYKKVVVYDPADTKTFVREYKEYGIDISAKVVTFTSYISEKIANGDLKVKKTNKIYTYQDPALLVREVGEDDEPRNIINSVATLKDMMLCKKETMYAGNLLMSEYMADVMDEMAIRRWDNAIATGADALVCASISEYCVLNRVKPDNMDLYTIEQIVLGE